MPSRTREELRALVHALAAPRAQPVVHVKQYADDGEAAYYPVPLATLRPRDKTKGWGKSMDLFARRKNGRT